MYTCKKCGKEVHTQSVVINKPEGDTFDVPICLNCYAGMDTDSVTEQTQARIKLCREVLTANSETINYNTNSNT